jgi:hypothetical protein
MNTMDREMRIESVPDANYQGEYQNDFDEIRRVLKEGIEITEHLLGYFRTLIEFDDRNRAKEQERIGKTLEGSDPPRSETRTGNAG